jgi:hypothetical protein
VSEVPPPKARARRRVLLALAAGVVLTLGYFVWLAAEPRGPFEFGYAPFAPDPLPYAPMRGFTYEQLWGHVARLLLLAPGLALLSFAATRLGIMTKPWPRSRALFATCGTSIVIAATCMLAILRGRVIVDDELVYRMQATFLREGHLAGKLFDFTPPDVFSIPTRLGYTGKYLPGEPLVQVIGVLVGVPALLHLPMFALTLFAWHRAMKLRLGSATADYATIALAISPMLMLTSATGLSEPTSLCCTALAALGYEWTRGTRPSSGALLVASAIAFGAAARPQSMLPVGVVLVPAAAWALLRRRSWVGIGALVSVLVAGAVAVGAYDVALSGSPLRLPWFLECGVEHYGFGRVWTTERFEHTPWTGLQNLGVVLLRLNAWWLGFPCSLAVLALFFLLPRKQRSWDIWYGVALAVVVFEFGYYSPGVSDTGSLYHYELILPGSLIAARLFEYTVARFPRLTTVSLLVHLSLGTATFVFEQSARLWRLVETIHRDSDVALAKIRPPAILFHEIRASERRAAGWVFDGFPERNRGLNDAVVTFPNVAPNLRAQVLALYPGRTCWYYRRDPDSERAKLERCEDARELMDRSIADDERRSLWIRPTAYDLTDFDPFGGITRGHMRDSKGRAALLCCMVSELHRLGMQVREDAERRCVPDRR